MTSAPSNYAGGDQPRAANGQFGVKMKMGPDVVIRELSDEEYNADGSYSFPPPARSAAQHIAFWETVPLPEARLFTLASGYGEMREQVGIEAGHAAAEAYKKDHPDPTKFKSASAEVRAAGEKWSAEVAAVWQAAYDNAVATMPPTIYRTTVRPLLRALQMVTYRGSLPAEEAQAVLNHEMVVDGQVMTAAQIVDTYQLMRLKDQLL